VLERDEKKSLQFASAENGTANANSLIIAGLGDSGFFKEGNAFAWRLYKEVVCAVPRSLPMARNTRNFKMQLQENHAFPPIE